MRRILGIALTLCVCRGGARCSPRPRRTAAAPGYQVRAIFDNAFSVIPGEDVKIAGVKVGKIESLDVTPDQKAAVVLRDRHGRASATSAATPHCTIRPQSLIGEKFVECTPTQPRPVGAPAPPLLPEIDARAHGPAPAARRRRRRARSTSTCSTTSCACPTASACRSSSTSSAPGSPAAAPTSTQVIRNADPALKETDKVLKLLAEREQGRWPTSRATPTPRWRRWRASARRSPDFIDAGGQHGARRRPRSSAAFEQNFAEAPGVPAPAQADDGPPRRAVGRDDAGARRTSARRRPRSTASSSRSGRSASPRRRRSTSLGDAPRSRAARRWWRPSRSRRTSRRSAARSSRCRRTSSSLLTSLQRHRRHRAPDGLPLLPGAAINGFDSFGHYLRAQLIVNTCTTYRVANDPSCTANFVKGSTSRATAASRDDSIRSPTLVRAGPRWRTARASRRCWPAWRPAGQRPAKTTTGGTPARSPCRRRCLPGGSTDAGADRRSRPATAGAAPGSVRRAAGLPARRSG